MSARRLDATALRHWAHTAVGDLIAHTDEINRLNVFPVADADTGTNMLFTMRAALRAGRCAAATTTSAAVTAALADGALHGARGNSGVILSQILRGLADVTAEAADERDGDLADIDATVFGAALRHAVGLVVASMGESVPGTIVSVLQAAAEAAEEPPRTAGADARRGRRIGGRSGGGRPGEDATNNSTCWPRPAWSTPAGAGCWSSSTR